MLPVEILDVAAALIGLGLVISVFSGRIGSISLGAGSVAVGLVLLSGIPAGWELLGGGFFGLIVIAGLWMIMIGLKEQKG